MDTESEPSFAERRRDLSMRLAAQREQVLQRLAPSADADAAEQAGMPRSHIMRLLRRHPQWLVGGAAALALALLLRGRREHVAGALGLVRMMAPLLRRHVADAAARID